MSHVKLHVIKFSDIYFDMEIDIYFHQYNIHIFPSVQFSRLSIDIYFHQYNRHLFPSRLSIDFFAFRWPSVISRSTNQLPRWPYINHDIHSRILF